MLISLNDPNCGGTYDIADTFLDPRLVSAAHSGAVTRLDRPPKFGGVESLARVYDPRPGYGGFYKSDYNDVVGGDVSYYYDTSVGKPFLEPLLFDGVGARVSFEPYVDPMGTFKPHYKYQPPPTRKLGLTALEDSQCHRQTLLADQMWKRNQEYPFMYFANNKKGC